MAIGAFALGALAIGALAIGSLAIGRSRIKRLQIDELVVSTVEAAVFACPTPRPARAEARARGRSVLSVLTVPGQTFPLLPGLRSPACRFVNR